MTVASRRRIAAVVRLELLTHQREPLTVLYMLVFVLLGAAFTASGPVDLVRDRGAVPRDAAWSIMLACTALTAFGQVITTMVAATIVLRDRADRVIELLTVTQLTQREYLIGKLTAALLLLGMIYSAVPVGLLLGAVLGGGSATQAATATLLPFALVVLPTMLAVGAIQFGAGVLSGRLWVIVGLGLVLIWIWSAAAGAAGSAAPRTWVALWDPFGSAPLLQATRDWSDAERASRQMPVTAVLLANRGIWLGIGALVAYVAIRFGSRGLTYAVVASPRSASAPAPSRRAALFYRPHPAKTLQGAAATARYVTRWMLRDTGWRVLAALGAVNVSVHVFLDAQGSATSAETTARTLAALVTHSQLFLILLATIYAGELVWREYDERSDGLFHAQPISDVALIGGRLAGVVTAQLALLAVLTTAACLAAVLGAGHAIDVAPLLRGVAVRRVIPFLVWMLMSLAVHVSIRQKVIGHLTLITGWVLAVLIAGTGEIGSNGGNVPAWAWGGVAAVALAVVVACWRRSGAWQAARIRRQASATTGTL